MAITFSCWIECHICGDDIPQNQAEEHYKKQKLVCHQCADEPGRADFQEEIEIPMEERCNLDGKPVAGQGGP